MASFEEQKAAILHEISTLVVQLSAEHRTKLVYLCKLFDDFVNAMTAEANRQINEMGEHVTREQERYNQEHKLHADTSKQLSAVREELKLMSARYEPKPTPPQHHRRTASTGSALSHHPPPHHNHFRHASDPGVLAAFNSTVPVKCSMQWEHHTATVFCEDCHEQYCDACFQYMHQKPTWAAHRGRTIATTVDSLSLPFNHHSHNHQLLQQQLARIPSNSSTSSLSSTSSNQQQTIHRPPSFPSPSAASSGVPSLPRTSSNTSLATTTSVSPISTISNRQLSVSQTFPPPRSSNNTSSPSPAPLSPMKPPPNLPRSIEESPDHSNSSSNSNGGNNSSSSGNRHRSLSDASEKDLVFPHPSSSPSSKSKISAPKIPKSLIKPNSAQVPEETKSLRHPQQLLLLQQQQQQQKQQELLQQQQQQQQQQGLLPTPSAESVKKTPTKTIKAKAPTKTTKSPQVVAKVNPVQDLSDSFSSSSSLGLSQSALQEQASRTPAVTTTTTTTATTSVLSTATDANATNATTSSFASNASENVNEKTDEQKSRRTSSHKEEEQKSKQDIVEKTDDDKLGQAKQQPEEKSEQDAISKKQTEEKQRTESNIIPSKEGAEEEKSSKEQETVLQNADQVSSPVVTITVNQERPKTAQQSQATTATTAATEQTAAAAQQQTATATASSLPQAQGQQQQGLKKQQQQQQQPRSKKDIVCKNIELGLPCKAGDKCQFSHIPSSGSPPPYVALDVENTPLASSTNASSNPVPTSGTAATTSAAAASTASASAPVAPTATTSSASVTASNTNNVSTTAMSASASTTATPVSSFVNTASSTSSTSSTTSTTSTTAANVDSTRPFVSFSSVTSAPVSAFSASATSSAPLSSSSVYSAPPPYSASLSHRSTFPSASVVPRSAFASTASTASSSCSTSSSSVSSSSTVNATTTDTLNTATTTTNALSSMPDFVPLPSILGSKPKPSSSSSTASSSSSSSSSAAAPATAAAAAPAVAENRGTVADLDAAYSSEITWESFGLPKQVLDGVYDANFTKPSAIQAQSIGPILQKKSVIAQAKAGSGKTAAFGIGMMMHAQAGGRALCVAPTRELAQQCAVRIKALAKYTQLSVCLVVPESKNVPEVMSGELTTNVSDPIVVGTPGAVRNMARPNKKFTMFVVDEADKMLDPEEGKRYGGGRSNQMGTMREQTLSIKNTLSAPDCQVLLFSATFSDLVLDFSRQLAKQFVMINTDKKVEEYNLQGLKYLSLSSESRGGKFKALTECYAIMSISQSVIFANSKATANKLKEDMENEGYTVSILHGDIPPSLRDTTMEDFRKQTTTVLIATDVFARGIDVQTINVVINYDIPANSEDYYHRVGRACRFGRKGVAINLIDSQRDRQLLNDIARAHGLDFIVLEFDPKTLDQDIKAFLAK